MRVIVWTRKASLQLEKIYRYIENDSPQNAENVILNILEKVDGIAGQERKYPADKYRINNKGDFRALEVYSIRISYQILEKEILIVRVRSTTRKALKY